jgi:hypothetical protein
MAMIYLKNKYVKKQITEFYETKKHFTRRTRKAYRHIPK